MTHVERCWFLVLPHVTCHDGALGTLPLTRDGAAPLLRPPSPPPSLRYAVKSLLVIPDTHLVYRLHFAYPGFINRSDIFSRSARDVPMSSPKDYILEISPAVDVVDDHNTLEFSIRHRNETVFDRYRRPVGVVAAVVMMTMILEVVGWPQAKRLQFGSWTNVVTLMVSALVWVALVLRQEPRDSVLVMKDIGIQLELIKPWRYQSLVKLFVPVGRIIDLVLHEGFHEYGQVIYYLVILTKPDPKQVSHDNIIKVVFPEFLPRKDVLLKVRSLSRDLLFGQRMCFRRVPGQGLRPVQNH